MQSHFKMMAHYNAWANTRLYDAAAAVGAEDYHAQRGAFFGSLHGTLNHILVGDRIWMRRITGEGEAPDTLDAILHDDFASLRAARETEDARIVAYVEGLDEAALGGLFTYRTITNPVDVTQPLGPALAHLFNHQTHHRGQAHCLLTQITGEAPSLDLIAFQRESRASGAG
ncbi:MAG TPA: DinB family protein [Saliniramus sp.]|nr:DinB family protein [Saliniramus sp.]